MRTNVYYLPAPTPDGRRASRRSPGLRLRLLAFWGRLRLTATDVGAALRRFGREDFDADELILSVPRPPGRPARIIDLAAARLRRRP
jgi:hypothetical protein